MMKTNLLKLIAIALVFASFSSCKKDDDEKPDVLTDKHKILVSIELGESSYYGTIKDLSVGSMTNANSYEHDYKACSFVYEDMVFISEHVNGDKLYKYTRTSDDILQPAGSLTLPAASHAHAMTFVDADKAYICLNGSGIIYMINPTTLEHTGDIDLTQYAVGDNNPDPGSIIARDGKLFVGLVQNITMFSVHDSAYVAVIDIATNSVDKVIIDKRVTSLSGSYNRPLFMDEKGDIYFYSQAVWGYQPGANDGFLRIKKGETEFDPDYYFSPQSLSISGIPDGKVSYAMAMQYTENGEVYCGMFVPALTSNPPDYANDKNVQPIVLDLYNKTAEKIDLNPTSGYASVGVARLDNKIIFGMSTINGDGLYIYDLVTGETSDNPVVTTQGPPQFLNVFDD